MAKGSQWVRWGFLGVVVPLATGLAAWQGWAWWSWATGPVAQGEPTTDQTVQIQIPPGTSGQEIGQDLEAAGLIRSALAWKLWSRWQARQAPGQGFQAGTYALSPTSSMADIAEKIWTGQVIQTSFTIPEGWNRRQMATYFEQQGFFPASEFLAVTEQIPRQRYPWLPEGIPHLEGFLFPDTYQIPADGLTATAVRDAMLKQFEAIALPLYQPNATELSLLDWVTLSSIVEKEAVIPDERGVIAGVFTNRLRQNIPLGADPTVEYGLGITQTPEQPLTWAQVGTPSPYNTYINPGLPPTPIASPGRASLVATLTPEATDYLFFVARYDGTHVFSRTLDEHEAAKNAIRETFNN
ncbi:MAG TPA: endolytic transglycosylase MltG [Leptolyngbyaceae cyanobacterium M65_K2018_010]|nr:endolytic transglycosylase MltG [Leptolyngbyaceae cyanobacterium M65_K2018_010]